MKPKSLLASLLCAVLAILAMAAPLYAQHSATPRPSTKLIEYGWDVPYPDYVRKNIRSMEKLPFDGVIFRLRDWNHAFDPRPWDEAQLKPQFDDLAAIQWNKFTDNFLCLYAANNWKMDWFDDNQWKAIAANLRTSAKAARIGHCVGIVFDPEPYGDNPWAWSAKTSPHTFAEVEAQVQKRGAQFMAALQTELPNIRLLTFFHQSLFADLLDIQDPQKRQERLSHQHWALLSAFWNGALEAAAPGTKIIDGYEPAYYFTRADQFAKAYDLIRRRSLVLVPPSLLDKHVDFVQAGMSLYVDQVYGLREPLDHYLSHYLTPHEQARWFEHNVYFALTYSNEYVWCYGEKLNWWNGTIPAGAVDAIRSARDHLAHGSADYADKLSSDIAQYLKAAQEKKAAEAKRKAAAPKPQK